MYIQKCNKKMKEENYKFFNLRGLNSESFVVQSLYKVLVKKFLSKKCVFKFWLKVVILLGSSVGMG